MAVSRTDSITPFTLMSNQSTDRLKPGMKVGVSTKPSDLVSETSGFRSGLPPLVVLHWDATHWITLPYCAAETPVLAHWAALNCGDAPAQGSVPAVRSNCVGW